MLKRDTPGQLLKKPHIALKNGQWVMTYARHPKRKALPHEQERNFYYWSLGIDWRKPQP